MVTPSKAAEKPKKAATQAQAQAAVDRHVSPKPCFVWFKNSKEGWTPIPGTGCAHYVAHQLGIKSLPACKDGYTFRVPALVAGFTEVEVKDVAVSDVWTNEQKKHTGLVVELKQTAGGDRDFVIEHCSSEQGGVVRNDWSTHFHAKGRFYRPAGASKAVPSAKTTARSSGLPVREAWS